jgi:hypothetical protein
MKIAALLTAPGTSRKVNATVSIPTDDFIACYAQARAQLNDPVQAAITAAAQYDTLADAPSDQLTNAVSLRSRKTWATSKLQPSPWAKWSMPPRSQLTWEKP